MDLLVEVQERLGRINSELAARADGARVAFISIEPDPDFDGEWLLVTTWQLPHLAESDGWPLSQLDTYCDLVSERLRDLGSTECLFRTAEELHTEGAPSGAALQVA